MYITSSVAYYDRIYASQGKDYQKEAEYLASTIRSHGRGKRQNLLDVACGTGNHMLHLRKYFDVEDVDISLDFIRIVRSRLPKAKLSVVSLADVEEEDLKLVKMSTAKVEGRGRIFRHA